MYMAQYDTSWNGESQVKVWLDLRRCTVHTTGEHRWTEAVQMLTS